MTRQNGGFHERILQRNQTPRVGFHEIIAVAQTEKKKDCTETMNNFPFGSKKRAPRNRQVYQGHNKSPIVQAISLTHSANIAV